MIHINPPDLCSDLPPVESTVTLSICQSYSPCEKHDYVFTNSYNPSFQYSYQCGTKLLTSFIPVLMYTYSIVGLVYPVIKLTYAVMPNIRKMCSRWSILNQEYENLLYARQKNDVDDYNIIRLHGRFVLYQRP